MTAIRVTISAFIGVLIVLSALGWVWMGSHQSPAEMVAGRAVLALGALAGVGGLLAIWRRPSHT